MKKIIFFTRNAWAFGNIHHSLSKFLFPHNILADVLDWSISYSTTDMDLISKNCDYFVTTPDAIDPLMSYGIPVEKIIIVAHGQWDILRAYDKFGIEIFDKVKAYGVVSENLLEKSRELGIKRIPEITPIGIIVENFIRPVPKKLTTIGYASSLAHPNHAGTDIKRGNLVAKVAEQTKTKLRMNEEYHYLGMPSFYESVDAVLMSSTEESAGLPMMEAAAAGRLTLGTAVGYYKQNGMPSGGVILPIEETEFVAEACRQIEYYQQNPREFQKVCRQIQAYARAHYDWSHCIPAWVKLLS